MAPGCTSSTRPYLATSIDPYIDNRYPRSTDEQIIVPLRGGHWHTTDRAKVHYAWHELGIILNKRGLNPAHRKANLLRRERKKPRNNQLQYFPFFQGGFQASPSQRFDNFAHSLDTYLSKSMKISHIFDLLVNLFQVIPPPPPPPAPPRPDLMANPQIARITKNMALSVRYT